MNLVTLIYLLPFIAVASCRIYTVQNPDGSYSLNLNSGTPDESAGSLMSLLKNPSSANNDNEPSRADPGQESRGFLGPHLEILQLVETFIKFKAELASRIQDLISDNYDLIRSLYTTAASKLGSLHSFTLNGIRILRKVLEIANSLMAQWQISVPGVSVDVNVGGNQDSSFSFNRNGNFYSG